MLLSVLVDEICEHVSFAPLVDADRKAEGSVGTGCQLLVLACDVFSHVSSACLPWHLTGVLTHHVIYSSFKYDVYHRHRDNISTNETTKNLTVNVWQK